MSLAYFSIVDKAQSLEISEALFTTSRAEWHNRILAYRGGLPAYWSTYWSGGCLEQFLNDRVICQKKRRQSFSREEAKTGVGHGEANVKVILTTIYGSECQMFEGCCLTRRGSCLSTILAVELEEV